MAPIAEQWKTQLGQLAPEDRAELALFLLQSLEPEDVQAAWDTEVARRVAEIRNGTAKGRPANEVFSGKDPLLRIAGCLSGEPMSSQQMDEDLYGKSSCLVRNRELGRHEMETCPW